MKYIFTDVDGTIFDGNTIITKELRNDFIFANNQGYTIVIATGNPIFSKMKWLMKELNVRYIIGSNGANIYDFKNKKYLFKSYISGDKINKIMLLAKKYKIFCDYWNEDFIFVSTFDDTEPFHLLMQAVIKENFSTNSIVLSNESKLTPAFKIEVYGNKEKIEDFYKELSELKLDLQIAYMNNHHIEITNIGISKASAIKEFLKEKNIDIKTCMTIGDSANDETMLRASDFSYAMGNSPDNIKSISKYVTKDMNKNGLGIAIRDYIFRTSK